MVRVDIQETMDGDDQDSARSATSLPEPSENMYGGEGDTEDQLRAKDVDVDDALLKLLGARLVAVSPCPCNLQDMMRILIACNACQPFQNLDSPEPNYCLPRRRDITAA